MHPLMQDPSLDHCEHEKSTSAALGRAETNRPCKAVELSCTSQSVRTLPLGYSQSGRRTPTGRRSGQTAGDSKDWIRVLFTGTRLLQLVSVQILPFHDTSKMGVDVAWRLITNTTHPTTIQRLAQPTVYRRIFLQRRILNRLFTRH